MEHSYHWGDFFSYKHESKRQHKGRGVVGKAIVAGLKDRETKEVRALQYFLQVPAQLSVTPSWAGLFHWSVGVATLSWVASFSQSYL